MKSRLPKVLHRVAGRPMVEHVLKTADAISPATETLIVGHGADMVRERLEGRHRGLQFALQEPQLGTAHALQQAETVLAGQTGTLVLLSGDVPLLTASTLHKLVERSTEAFTPSTWRHCGKPCGESHRRTPRASIT